MATCAYCKSSGFFDLLSVDEHNLCSRCRRQVIKILLRLWNIFFESQKIIKETKNKKTLLRRLDTAKRVLSELNMWKRRGVNVQYQEGSISRIDIDATLRLIDEMRVHAEAAASVEFSMKNKICAICKHAAPKNANFCMSCGASLNQRERQAPPPPVSEKQDPLI